MKFETIRQEIEGAIENFHTAHGDIYITSENMKKFANTLSNCDDEQEVLIVPYLINLEEGGTYELLYYQFLIEILDVSQSHFLEFHPKNVLPREIVEKIKPKAVVPSGDKAIFVNVLQEYLAKMDEMLFEECRNADERLKAAKLFYQIF